MSRLLGLARATAFGLSASAAPRQWPGGAEGRRSGGPPGTRFLVNLSAGIGDALMALPMIRVLRACVPGSRVTLLATPVNAALLGPEAEVDDVVTWPVTPGLAPLLALARKLRATGFDAAVCALPSDLVSTSLVLRMAGIPLRIKHLLVEVERCRDWQFCFTDLVAPRPTEHKVVENIALLVPAGLSVPHHSTAELARLMRLSLTADERRAAAARFPRRAGGSPRLGMHPGCKPGWEFKRWQPRNFAALADRLAERHGAEVVWFGGADEAALVDSIRQAMRTPSITVAGALGVRESAALMASCDAFVSNDSGPMHMATASGVPTIGLFSSANPRTLPSRTGPFGPDHTIVARPDLQAIGVEDVAAAVAATLARAAAGQETSPARP